MSRLKHHVKKILQAILGFDQYLFLFSIFKIATMPLERAGEGEFNLFLAHLPRDGVVIDAGANIGVMSVLMARRANRGAIHAFEPIPANIRTLEKIIRFFRIRNVTTHPIALGDRDQQVEMVLPEQDAVKLQGYGHVIDDTIQGYPDGEHFRVPCRRLDGIEALQEDNVRITGIKIDVEGFEYPVLKGAEKLIDQHRPIIYCEVGAGNRSRTFEFFARRGYHIMVAEGKALAPYDAGLHAAHGNLFAMPD